MRRIVLVVALAACHSKLDRADVEAKVQAWATARADEPFGVPGKVECDADLETSREFNCRLTNFSTYSLAIEDLVCEASSSSTIECRSRTYDNFAPH